MSRRLFIAMPFPGEVVSALHAIQQGIRGARWVPEGQMHLTLRFLGDVEEECLEPLQEQLAAIRLDPFPLAVAGTGCFPPRGRARVLWAGLAPSPPLQELSRLVEAGVGAAGLPAEIRPFSPHVTLARLADADPGEVRRYLDRQQGLGLAPFPVEQFILYASQLTPRGALHAPVATFNLGSGPPDAP
jgi:2'-5' RNA ligase